MGYALWGPNLQALQSPMYDTYSLQVEKWITKHQLGLNIQIVDGGWSNPILTLEVISFAFRFTFENKA
jgi:hypothetical protein